MDGKQKAPAGQGGTFAHIPSVSILNGKIVLARNGEYAELPANHPFLSGLGEGFTPPTRRWGRTLAVFERLFQDYPLIYVLDLDGIQRNSPQLDLLRAISERGTIWADPGVWRYEHGMDLLMVGVEGLVIASKSIRGMGQLKDACKTFEDVIVSIDFDGELIAARDEISTMGPLGFADAASSLGVRRFVFADLRRDRIDEDMVGALAGHCPELYVGGGVRAEHADRIKELGARGAVLELSDVLGRVKG